MRAIRSRVVLPITAPPIEDGAVLVSGQHLAAVGSWSELRHLASGPALDLGDVLLLPGLINAHAHLDYTAFAGHISPPKTFTDWLQGVIALKAQWSFSEYAASWIAGARQLLDSGCTTVFDMEAVPELLPDAWQSTPLRIISALELTGVRSQRRPDEILADTLRCLDRIDPTGSRTAIAPHAPYSTRAELVRLAAEAARARQLPVTMHVAESRDEFDMFLQADGPMYRWLRGQRDPSDCGDISPIAHVARARLLGPNSVLAHVNFLHRGDLELLAASGCSVVHCPRSHHYFSRPPFPLADLQAAGINVCLGSDSLLSTRKLRKTLPRLDLFADLAMAAEAFPQTAPDELLRWVTVAAARALGRSGQLGELSPGARADLIAIPFSGRPDEAASAVIHHAPPVFASMIDGQWALPPPGVHPTTP